MILINEKEKEIRYVFDTKINYGGISCLNNYFKYDKNNKVLYFQRSYEFCIGTYYKYDIKTGELSEMDDGLVGFDRETALGLLAEDNCFTKYFDNFKSFSLGKF
jgi:hypothetical protein